MRQGSVLRRGEGVAGVALYIVANPVRRGLVEDWEAYPFARGSLLAPDAAPRPAPGDLKVAATSGARHGGLS